MAAITAPERTAAQHQSLLHFVGQGAWSLQQHVFAPGKAVGPAGTIMLARGDDTGEALESYSAGT